MEKFSLNELQIALLGSGIIDLQGTVDDEMFQYVRDSLLWLAVKGNPPIRVQISSSGGGAVAGLAIYDMLRLYPGETTGVVVGFTKSVAVYILQACATRLCMQNASLLIHEVYRDWVHLDELKNEKKRKKMEDVMEKVQIKASHMLEKRTGKSRSRIRTLFLKGNDGEATSAEEALKFGLIDKII